MTKKPTTTFATLLDRMRAAQELGKRDPEASGGDSDQVLVQAIRFMASHRVSPIRAEELIALYEKVPRYM